MCPLKTSGWKTTFPYENGPLSFGEVLVFAGVRLQGRAVSFREDNQTFDHGSPQNKRNFCAATQGGAP